MISFSGSKIKEVWLNVMVALNTVACKSNVRSLHKKAKAMMVSMQINSVFFEAGKLFHIDLSVVISSVSAITTYLIVLMQFGLSENPSSNTGTLTYKIPDAKPISYNVQPPSIPIPSSHVQAG